MKPIARIGDSHNCPLTNPPPTPTPHTGGPVLPAGMPTVFAGGKAVAVVGNQCTCAGPPDVIQAGSMSVFVGGMAVARLGDATLHGGLISTGLLTVQVG